MKKRKNKHKHDFGKGWLAGYSEYRYGSKRSGKVYDPRQKVAKPDPEQVKQVATALVHWQANPWEKEATLTHHLRRKNIEKAKTPDWQTAEDAAEATVRMAFNFLGRGVETRPAPDEGQAEYTISEDYCLGCHGPLEDSDIQRQRRFCSDLCAAIVANRRNFTRGNNGPWEDEIDRIGLAAYIELEKAKNEPRCCEHCGDEFRPRYEWKDQKYCSKRCKYKAARVIEPRPCLCCGEEFRPRNGTNPGVYCSKRCEVEHRKIRTFEKTCVYCGVDFRPHSPRAKFCSKSCTNAFHSEANGRMPAVLRSHVFDHYLIVLPQMAA